MKHEFPLKSVLNVLPKDLVILKQTLLNQKGKPLFPKHLKSRNTWGKKKHTKSFGPTDSRVEPPQIQHNTQSIGGTGSGKTGTVPKLPNLIICRLIREGLSCVFASSGQY